MTNIKFSVEYHTQWGEDIRLQYDGREYPMTTTDGKVWTCDLHLALRRPRTISYNYAMYRDDKHVWSEWSQAPHILYVDSAIHEYVVNDKWRPIPDELPLYSTAYTDQLSLSFDPLAPAPVQGPAMVRVQIRTFFPHLQKGERLAIATSLGKWTVRYPMRHVALHEWVAELPAEPFEYKFVLTNAEGEVTDWEMDDNRTAPVIGRRNASLKVSEGDTRSTSVSTTYVVTVHNPRFDRKDWRVAGIVIPVFSIRSHKSWGVGDFENLKSMVSWAASVGMHAVQILPVNDTTMTYKWTDSYPYKAISIYALHPQYMHLPALGVVKSKRLSLELDVERSRLNALPQVDYEGVMALKMRYIRAIFEQVGSRTLQSKAYKEFVKQNEHWLIPYAVFCMLRDKYKTAVFSEWPKYSKYNAEEIKDLADNAEVRLHCYIQYHLHVQLLEVRSYASSLGVLLKGDIPIGISRDSVEAWMEPHYFNLNGQAGAPPDAFAVAGQNWGFPTYNWNVMSRDGYRWWKRRFAHMSQYFNAYRIDHVLGFFRIWEIPMHSVEGLLGQFVPAKPMSKSEIQGYGLRFDTAMTKPLVTDEILNTIFGNEAERVRRTYLERQRDGQWVLKPDFDTQRKVQANITDKKIAAGLFRLINNVLFVPDRTNPQGYHPRIIGSETLFFASLDEGQQNAYKALHDDYFFRRHTQFWYEQAMQKLPPLTQSTRMLVCAEDLGMVPDCVPWVMKQLRMLSLEIQTMPKNAAYTFGHLNENPKLSVATISTHDMPTMRQWWKEDAVRTSNFYHEALGHPETVSEELTPQVAEEIVVRHLQSPSMLCLLSFQDWLAIDASLRLKDADAERINIPANPNHYWRYRMHLSVEQLGECASFNAKVADIIKQSGR